MRRADPYVLFLAVVGIAFVWSAIRPMDYGVWFFELSLGLAGVLFLVATRRRFPFSGLVYALGAVHFVILACGAKYTYAEMPLFNWLRDALDLSRNHFDRVGHFFQGVVPAMLARELLLRTSPLKPGKWLFTLCVAVALAISALYELFEWRYAVTFGGQRAADFLGSQGDIWDAQEDMLMAFIGAVVAQLFLSRLHDRQIAQLGVRSNTAMGKSH